MPESNEFRERFYGGMQQSQGEKNRDESQSLGGHGIKHPCPLCGAESMSDESLELHLINHKLAGIANLIELFLEKRFPL